ncbi:MAG: hypothetical protein GY870_15810 [archaeon]|nr:hypothetical protein [archaeon]
MKNGIIDGDNNLINNAMDPSEGYNLDYKYELSDNSSNLGDLLIRNIVFTRVLSVLGLGLLIFALTTVVCSGTFFNVQIFPIKLYIIPLFGSFITFFISYEFTYHRSDFFSMITYFISNFLLGFAFSPVFFAFIHSNDVDSIGKLFLLYSIVVIALILGFIFLGYYITKKNIKPKEKLLYFIFISLAGDSFVSFLIYLLTNRTDLPIIGFSFIWMIFILLHLEGQELAGNLFESYMQPVLFFYYYIIQFIGRIIIFFIQAVLESL